MDKPADGQMDAERDAVPLRSRRQMTARRTVLVDLDSGTRPGPQREDQLDDPQDGEGPAVFRSAPRSVTFKKLRKRLVRETRQAIADYGMVTPGERWMVCLSGGKDSYTLLAVLADLKWRGLLPVDLLAVNLDQGQPNFPKDTLPTYLTSIDVPFHIETQDTYSIVTEKLPESSTYCALCSRLRRGILYRLARTHGCQKVVLGHHREDILETFFLNLFHGGRLASMPPKLINEERDLMVIRPLAYCAEADIAKFAALMAFPIIPCDLCGSQEGLQRNEIKAMLNGWEKAKPGRKQVMLRAMAHARPSHLLDRELFDFTGLSLSGD